jgi:hypothetical protein
MTMRARLGIGIGIGLAIGIALSAAPARAEQGGERVPRADEPLLPATIQPTLTLEAGAGVLGYIGGTAGLGPAWDIRAIFGVTRRIAIEGNYIGSFNERSGRPGSLIYTGIDAAFRYNFLLPEEAPLVPFLAAGVGYAAYIGRDGDAAALTFPIAVGVERLLLRQIKVGARLNLRPSTFDDLGAPGEVRPPGGDTWSLTANLGGAF